MHVYRMPELTGEIEQKMQSALCGDGEFIKAEVARGVSALLCLEDETGEYFVVLRDEKPELVCVVLAGSGMSAEPVTDFIFNFAKQNGFAAVRFHTKRKGLARYLKKYSPKYKETVYQVEI